MHWRTRARRSRQRQKVGGMGGGLERPGAGVLAEYVHLQTRVRRVVACECGRELGGLARRSERRRERRDGMFV